MATKNNQAQELAQTKKEALRGAVEKSQKALTEKASKENVENFMTATAALDECLDWLFNEDPGQQERRFKNMTEVAEYLKGQGWKIGHSKAYTDRKAGKIKAQADGSFLMSDVDRYIVKAELKKSDGVDPVGDLQNRKSLAEAKKLEAAAELLELKAKIATGKYVPREQMEHELAGRATILKKDIENFFRSSVAEIVTLVDGDQTKTPDLLEHCLDKVADFLDRYAKNKNFQI